MDQARPKFKLSDRERQLINLAIAGSTDTAIAQRLGISEATVGTYWGRIRIKLGPYSRTELVAIVLRSEQEEALQSLRDENAHLVQQLEESAKTNGIESSFYEQLIENAPDAMIVVSSEGSLIASNEAAHEMFGYESGAMKGISLLDLIPTEHREAHIVHRKEYVEDPRRRMMGEHLQTPALHKSGQSFPVRAALSAINAADGLVILCAVRKAD
ncbi:MAG TPA: PAS domain S-box protein [Fimbriimonas sp.]|nr:PAS domain S-box protein [Fimbriimonas sp.]